MRHTRGLENADIAGPADHREALLHSIRKGVVAVGNDREITLLNDSARDLLGLDEDAVGRRVDQAGLDPDVVDFLQSGDDGRDVVIRHQNAGPVAEPACGQQCGSPDRHGDHDARQPTTPAMAGWNRGFDLRSESGCRSRRRRCRRGRGGSGGTAGRLSHRPH